MPTPRDHGPMVDVEATGCRPGAVPDEWLATWRVANIGPRPLVLQAAWLPHGRFRGERRDLVPPPRLLPGESTELELPVRCREAPGTVVENAFVILSALWGDEPWRILARLEVAFDGAGAPRNACVLITTQPIGFAR